MNEKPMMRTVDPNVPRVVEPLAAVIYLRGAEEEFERACELSARELRDMLKVEVSIIPAECGGDILAAAAWFAEDGVSRLVLLGHGSPVEFLRPGRAGLHRWMDRGDQIVSVRNFAKHWAPVLAPGAIISLAACLCSRSPHWYLQRTFGRYISPWGNESYLEGGVQSLAQRIVECLADKGKPNVTVRGHTAAGHCTDLAMVRSHTAKAKIGRSMWQEVTQTDTPPTLAQKRKWHQIVRGNYARHFLLGLNDREILTDLRSVF